MPYQFDSPLVTETTSMRIRSFFYNDDTREFEVVMTHYNAEQLEVKTETVTFPAIDGVGNVIMPSDWPPEYPSGETIYGLMKLALYGRYKEVSIITQSGVLV